MRNGWVYSLFAGVVAVPIAVWFVRSHVTHDLSIMSQIVAAMTLAAVVAARVSGWLARWTGGREYGGRAAVFTGLLYLVFCGSLAVVLEHWSNLSHASVGHIDPSIVAKVEPWTVNMNEGPFVFAWWFVTRTVGFSVAVMLFYAWWTIFPACIVGTALFHWLVKLAGYPPDDVCP